MVWVRSLAARSGAYAGLLINWCYFNLVQRGYLPIPLPTARVTSRDNLWHTVKWVEPAMGCIFQLVHISTGAGLFQLVRGYLSTLVSSIGVFNRRGSLDLLTDIKLEHHANWHGSTELSFIPFYTPHLIELGEL